MSMKLLSPAGDMQSLKAAVYNGADEIYLGIRGFNARNNIEGFSLDTLDEAIKFAHLYGVKVHLAVNILFSDDELQQALEAIIIAYNKGVDAFIIQDLGLAHILHTNYPGIEIHASTQMGICSLEGAKYVSSFGFRRIVLARETSLEEIKRIKNNLGIEIEYFAQGALCVSFSGNCYLSSYICNASGNRGKCKQLCRLPYSLHFKNKKIKDGYLLSAKDFNMLNRLNDLEEAGVDAIKIEGRARRPYYVAVATKTYREALDKHIYSDTQLQRAFSRLYTEGYFNGNGNIISPYKSHIGLPIGKTIKINKGKRFNEVVFTSNIKLNPKSTFKVFVNQNEITTFTAYSLNQKSQTTYSTTTTQNIPQNGDIHLIVDELQEQEILNYTKKIPVEINIKANASSPINATLTTGNIQVQINGSVPSIAKSQPISINDILQSFTKSEYFSPNITATLDNIFLTKQQINSFRRECYNTLYEELTKPVNLPIKVKKINITHYKNALSDFEIISNYETLPNAQNIIYSPESYSLKDIQMFITACNLQNKTPILDTPNFINRQDYDLLINIINTTGITIIANNYALLHSTDKIIAGAGLNIYNSISAKVINKPFLTAEYDFGSKIAFPYMTLRHCPMKEHLNGSCNNCPYKDGYVYQMQNGEKLNLKRKKLSSCTFYLTKN